MITRAPFSVVEYAAALERGELDAVEALDLCVRRIEKRNPALNAFLALREKGARADAQSSVARRNQGAPLSRIDGLPFGVKANIAVAGLPLHAGIATYKDDIAQEDAAVVRKLRAAGAIPIGILNMHEGALGATTDNPHFGRCNNPWRLSLTPGGSSGGSAVAVAAGLVPFALGTDTMGSVRIPSAYCGIAGFKPGKGRISDAGLLALSPTLDHIGVHAMTAADIAIVSVVLIGADLSGAPAISIGQWGGAAELDDDVAIGFEAATRVMNVDAQHPSTDVSGFDFGALRRKGLLVSEVEGFAIHKARLAAARGGFSSEFAGLLEWGAGQPQERIDAAYAAIAEAGARFAALVEAAGVLVLPTAPQGPFPFGAPTPANQADFTCLANFAGLPAIAVPASDNGAPPSSIQFIAPRGRDASALAAALAFEEARGPAPRAPQ